MSELKIEILNHHLIDVVRVILDSTESVDVVSPSICKIFCLFKDSENSQFPLIRYRSRIDENEPSLSSFDSLYL